MNKLGLIPFCGFSPFGCFYFLTIKIITIDKRHISLDINDFSYDKI